jgi:peroxiredoxin
MVLKTFFQWLLMLGGIFVCACISGCTPPPVQTSLAPATGIVLVNEHGRDVPLAPMVGEAPFTVIEFFSAHCPCQRAHDARLRELFETYSPRGVKFLAIDSEDGASPERVAKESHARNYPFPLLADPKGTSAQAFGAIISMYTVILDREGHVRYEGGLDSNRAHLSASATFYVRDALDDLLAGREPRTKKGKALGCTLLH